MRATGSLAGWVGLVLAAATGVATAAETGPLADDTTRVIAPGRPGTQPFWNTFARRFIYAPAFDFPAIAGAAAYRFDVVGADGVKRSFNAASPSASLAPVWADAPEGVTTVTVRGRTSADGDTGIGIHYERDY